MPEVVLTPLEALPEKGAFWLFHRAIDAKSPESARALLALLAGVTLCAGFLALDAAVVWQAVFSAKEEVNGELVAALLGVATLLTIMATFSYLKPESTGGPS